VRVLSRSDHLTSDALRLLHRGLIEDRTRIRAILERLEREQVVLQRGLTDRIDREAGQVAEIREDRFFLRARHFERERGGQSFLNFELDGAPYFFEASPVGDAKAGERDGGWLTIAIPSGIYAAERRSVERRQSDGGTDATRRVALCGEDGATALDGDVTDWSHAGLSVRVPATASGTLPSEVNVRYLDGESAGVEAWGEVRYRDEEPDAAGTVRLGLAVTRARPRALIPIERRERILDVGAAGRLWQRVTALNAAAKLGARRALPFLRPKPKRAVPLVTYTNDRGEEIRAIADVVGDPRGAPAIVIPPAWGKTKETLLPLAATIAASFERAREPVVVIRFDGVRRRGESHNDPQYRAPGREYERFSFSQSVRDIETTLDHLEREYGCRRALLVTFSAAAIEGRRVAATDSRVAGWVSVVGAADLQSALRVVSGGIDFPYGYLRGVRFGIQEILGVSVDMDLGAADSLEHGLWFAEDERRDMADVTVPVTWIHGRHDAWMDLERARKLLSCGDTSQRRLLEIPIGHQVRTSRMALESFQLIASEALRILCGKSITPVLPDLTELEDRRRAERARIKGGAPDLHAFWQDYLLGRDRAYGIDLMAAVSSYEDLMRLQVERLELSAGARVADLGAGTGPLVSHFAREAGIPASLEISALDFVGEALDRARSRAQPLAAAGVALHPVRCDLDVEGEQRSIPLRSGAYEAVLASLLVSYLRDPGALLRESHRLLRPGGRIVVSSLRRDADTSKLYVEGVEELRAGRAHAFLGEHTPEQLTEALRRFLNDAARLLDLEEDGTFRFFDAGELVQLVRAAGFRDVRADEGFGDPPQAVVVSARR
jgi:ubiquinone/menaquinone biosynthesis C-methylase UbiE/pimeloyl-ACP methyl ester carboxylesterase